MFLLDTNVVSELRRPRPHRAVLAWIEATPPAALFLCAVSVPVNGVVTVSIDVAFAVVAYLLIVGVAFGLTQVFSARAAYIHLGALFGTIMAANVWQRILPAQRKMIAALKAGQKPDDRLSAQAKLRSKQNTFMAVPVVFIMISNHFPGVTYGDRYNWIILSILILLGWIAAKFIRRA